MNVSNGGQADYASETEHAQRSTTASRELLLSILDSLPANLAVIDRRGTIVAVNERWRRYARQNGDPMLAHTCEGVNYLDVCRHATGPDSQGAGEALAGLEEVLCDEAEEFELEYPCSVPTCLTWHTMRVRAIESPLGGAVIIHVDITKRKTAEEELRESRQRLEAIQDALTANLAMIDGAGTIVAVNERWRRFARENGDTELSHTCEGVNYLEVCRQARGDFSAGADQVLAGLQDILAGRLREFETEYPCPSESEWRWFFMRAAPMGRGIPGAVIAHIDITQRKQAEEALVESEARYHSLVDNLDAVVFRMDANMRLLALAGHVESTLGYSAKEIMDDPALWWEVVHPDDRRKAEELMKAIRQSGVPRWIELRVRRREGGILWIRGTLTPIFDDDGGFIYYDGVSLDVTERVLAHEREATYTRRMRVLSETSQAFASTMEPQEILDIATKNICETLDCSTAGITVQPSDLQLLHLSMCCPGKSDTAYATKRMDDELRKGYLTVGGVFGAVEIKPAITADIRSLSPSVARFADDCGLKPGMIAPVSAGEDMAGVLITARPPDKPFTDDELWFLTEIASHASAALANAALYGRQTQIAETLQRSLIPPTPEIEYLDVATLYAPAPTAQVGGDFFDMLRINNKSFALVVGDVSGKGLEAAIHTAEAKYMIRGFLHQNHDPAHVMSNLNSALCQYLPSEAFITLAYLIIDAENHTIDYVNAGHETCLIRRECDNNLIEITPSGPILGVTKVTSYSVRQLEFGAGDLLFCYTDGLIDVRCNGERFGYDRLRDAIASAPVDTAQSVIDHVMRQVRSCGVARQTDDQVVVALKPLV